MPLDSLDRMILAQLQEDGRRSYREMSERLGVSPATVRTRVLQLLAEDIVSVIAVPNPARMGYQFHANVGLILRPGHAEEVADLLVAREEVGWVGLNTTGYDVLFEVILEHSRAFGDYKERFLARLPGCRQIDVFEVWKVRKLHYRMVPADTDDAARSGGRDGIQAEGALAP